MLIKKKKINKFHNSNTKKAGSNPKITVHALLAGHFPLFFYFE